ncbi:MAG: hypothetical protein Q9176_006709 [Flavoplaca citrina]
MPQMIPTTSSTPHGNKRAGTISTNNTRQPSGTAAPVAYTLTLFRANNVEPHKSAEKPWIKRHNTRISRDKYPKRRDVVGVTATIPFLLSLLHFIYTSTSAPSSHPALSLAPPSSDNPNPNTPSPPTTHPLLPRDWRDPSNRAIFNRISTLSGGWSLYYNTLDIMSPNIPIAADSLLHFYDLVIESLEDGWAPRQRVYAVAGEIKLVMETANGIITKEWVVGFVRALKKRVVATNNAGGTMASFRMTAVSAVSGAAVVCALVLPWAGGAPAA